MNQNDLFLTTEQLTELCSLVRNFLRLPFGFKSVPGNLLEEMIAQVRGNKAIRLPTYDFVDVVDRTRRVGWQVKSLDHDTPVTWMRAKIRNKQELIKESQSSDEGRAALGRAILTYCNDHAAESLTKYNLEQIGYIRLINHGTQFVYFEIPLINTSNPILFNPDDYEWNWSEPKKTVKKEQLQAFHAYNRHTGTKAFAWHGLGENQLHFAGEGAWWPKDDYVQRMVFNTPTEAEMVTAETLTKWLAQL